jgi:hypothetical protein
MLIPEVILKGSSQVIWLTYSDAAAIHSIPWRSLSPEM